jgi:hypothetical protein
VVGNDITLYIKITALYHDSTLGGHLGTIVTTKRVASWFYWKG